jgi:hypothetical protein
VPELLALGGLAPMKNISTFRLAFWSGVFAEATVCVLYVMCLGYGSSAPGHAAISILSFISMFHLPSLWLGAQLARMVGIITVLPLTILGGMFSFAVIFWVSISLWRRFCERHTSA